MKKYRLVRFTAVQATMTIAIVSALMSAIFLLAVEKSGLIHNPGQYLFPALFFMSFFFNASGTSLYLAISKKLRKQSGFVTRPLSGRVSSGKEYLSENGPAFLYRSAFYAIVAVLEARDPYTSHHSERVAKMTKNFCEVLQIPLLQTNMIEMAAAVHDIGKVGIRDSTLQNPGKLSDEQWREMKTHPTIGARILSQSGIQLKGTADTVIAHHEHWDGSGYPRGLKGDEIPYAARIIAICDSVDAMLSNRIYRNAMDGPACRNELIKGRGKAYQPELIDSFLSNWDKIVGELYNSKSRGA